MKHEDEKSDLFGNDKSYEELEIRFPPSYRHRKENDGPIVIDGTGQAYDASSSSMKQYSPEWARTYGNDANFPHHDGKRRMPWWTDRVFCKSKREIRNASTYECLFNIERSDHRPVRATFVFAAPHLVGVGRRRRLKKLRQIHPLYNEILDAND